MGGRTRTRPAPGVESPELAALVNYIRDRKCVLFVGAGLSRAAGLPDWGSLMRTMVATAREELATPDAALELQRLLESGRYLELADQCRELLSRARFHQVLKQILEQPALPTDVHRAIVETPYACVVTTNFDTLLEDAYARYSGRGLPRTPTGMELANQGTLLLDGAFFVLKAHGTLQHTDSLVFTADDYRRITYANPAFQAFLSALLLSHAVLFVGYSLSDPNFRLLLDSQLTTFDGEVPSRYAVMAGVGPMECELMWRTARIRVLPYPEGRHEYVGQVIQSLAERASVDALGTRARVTVRETIGAMPPIPTYQMAIRGRGGQFDFGFRGGPSADPLSALGDRDDEWWATEAAVPNWTDLMTALRTSYSAVAASAEDLARAGRLLDSVVPERVRDWLASVPDEAILSLDFTTDAEIFPWEWLNVGGVPLGLRLAVARRPVGISSTARGRPFAARRLRALIVGDPSAESVPAIPLPGALAEAREVARVLQQADEVDHVCLLVQREATYARFMHELRTGWYDVVHFAGHAWFDTNESFIALHDGQVRASELVSAFNRHPPSIVMLNSHYTAFLPAFCDASDVRYPALPTIGDALQLLASRRRGFTELAARSGVGAFIGCLGNPGDESARLVAVELYRALVRGEAVAHAMRDARRKLARPSRDQTCLLYTLSGYGDLRLRPRRPARPRSPGNLAASRRRRRAGTGQKRGSAR